MRIKKANLEKIIAITKELEVIAREEKISMQMNIPQHNMFESGIEIRRSLSTCHDYDCLSPTETIWSEKEKVSIDNVIIGFQAFRIVNIDKKAGVA